MGKKMSRLFIAIMFFLTCCTLLASDKIEHILKKIEEHQVEIIHLLFVSPIGDVKSVDIPRQYIKNALKNGQMFDGSSIPGYSTITDSDKKIITDLDSFGLMPSEIEENAAYVFGDVDGGPRSILRDKLEELKEKTGGGELKLGAEVEYFLMDRENPNNLIDHDKYFDFINDSRVRDYIHQMARAAFECNLGIEKYHHEVASGQQELVLHHDEAFKMADKVILARLFASLLAREKNMEVNYSPKPFQGMNGSGMHIHFSIYDPQNDKNLFYDSEDEYGLSKIGRQATAGVLAYQYELALLYNPVYESFLRLTPGHEAPIFVGWGRKNRTCSIRKPDSDGNPMATRMEVRSPDSACNPYLAFAAIAASITQGIEQNMPLPEEIKDNLYQVSPKELEERGIKSLPQSLEESIANLRHSNIFKDNYPNFSQRYIQAIERKEEERKARSPSFISK